MLNEWFLSLGARCAALVFLCGGHFFLHHYFATVVQFPFVPVGPVEKVHFAGGGVFGQLWDLGFVVGSSFVSSGAGLSSLWMCHF